MSEEMTNTDDALLLNILLHECAQARDDDRHMNLQFALIISVGLGLILAMAALFYKTCPLGHCTEGLTAIPVWIYIGAPMLPTALITYAVLTASIGTLRSYYIRTLENRIHILTKQQPNDLPIPSWGHIQLEVTGQAHSGLVARFIWFWTYGIILLLSLGCIYLAFVKIPDLRLQIFALAVDVILLAVPVTAGIVSVRGGARLWKEALAELPKRLSRTSANFPPRQVLNARSLGSFLFLPRKQEELLKALFIPISFLRGRVLSQQFSSLTAEKLWYFAGFFLVFEFLVYQARYLLNDVRDRRIDCGPKLLKRRFPPSWMIDGLEPIALKAAFASFIIRLTFAALLVFCILPLDNWAWHIGFLLSIFLIAMLYEVARDKCKAAATNESGRYNRRWTVVVIGVVGLGYGLRSVVGMWLAGVDKPVALVLIALGASLLGSTFVALTWAIESTRAGTDELAAGKPHLLLFRSAVCRAAIRAKVDVKSTERVLVGRQSMATPWCISAVLSTAALMAFSLYLLQDYFSTVIFPLYLFHTWFHIPGQVFFILTAVVVAGIAVITPVRLCVWLTAFGFVGLAVVLWTISVPITQSAVAALVTAFPLIMTCSFRTMRFDDLPDMDNVIKLVSLGMSSLYSWFIRAR